MRVASVNVSRPVTFEYNGKQILSGIFKRPVEGKVKVSKLNLEGDEQADLRVHGGPYMAVYAYPLEHYAYWSELLNRSDLESGQFGENLTVEGMTEDAVHLGDIFRIGTAVLQVTQPRGPCYKLAAKMNVPEFVQLFMTSLRVGYYLRVLEEGELTANDPIVRIEMNPQRISIREIYRITHFDPFRFEVLQSALKIDALSPGWRSKIQKILNRT
jgi:MOSC domain-containing protein YiiM